MQPLVDLRGVVVRYPGLGDSEPPVLDGVDLELRTGQSVAVVGPSGSGKSTLLNVTGALLPPTAGEVRFGGQTLAGRSPDQLADLRSAEIGYVFQAHHLLPQCTALENVLVPSLARPAAERAGALARARELLDEVGLGARTGHRPAQLSGGECQRVAVVRALINRPRVLLCDEPTGSLDAAAAAGLAELLCGLNERQGTALLVVTHSEALAARMQRVLELRSGRLTERGGRS